MTLANILRPVPLIGRLADCTIKDHAKGAKDFLFAIVFSTTTFWLTWLILLAQASSAKKTTISLLLSTFSNGELFIFAVSFVGPIFLATVADRAAGKSQLTGKEWHLLPVLLIALVAATMFSQLKVQALAPGAVLLNMDIVRSMSYVVAGAALTMRYLTLVYQQNMASLDTYGPRADRQFATQYADHARDQENHK